MIYAFFERISFALHPESPHFCFHHPTDAMLSQMHRGHAHAKRGCRRSSRQALNHIQMIGFVMRGVHPAFHLIEGAPQ